jgi:hypothetical protein
MTNRNQCHMGFGIPSNTRPGYDSNAWGISYYDNLWRNNSSTAIANYQPAVGSNGDIFMFAVDTLRNGEFYWGRNGTWVNGSNPETRTNPLFSNIVKRAGLRAVGTGYNTVRVTGHFDEPNMNYSIPSGYMAPVAS